MSLLTQQIQEKFKATGLALLVTVLLQLAVAEPLQGLGSLDHVAPALGAFLQLVAVHASGVFNVAPGILRWLNASRAYGGLVARDSCDDCRWPSRRNCPQNNGRARQLHAEAKPILN